VGASPGPGNVDDGSARRRADGWALERRFATIAVAVSVFASLVAFGNAWHVSMWVDEAYTISVATRSLSDLWRMIHHVDIVHSLYNVVLHPWLLVFGVSEVSVRLPSAVAVGAATAGVMVLGRRLAGAHTAVLAGLLFAMLPRVTSAGIEGRSYALTMAVAVWLTVLLVSLLARPTRGRHLGYAASAALAGSLNIFLLLLLCAHGVTLLLERRYRVGRVLLPWSAAALGGVAGAAPVLVTAVGQGEQIGESRYGPAGYLRAVLVNQWFLGETPTVSVPGGVTLGPGAGVQLWKYTAVLMALGCWALVAAAVLRRAAAPVDGPPHTPTARTLLLPWLVVPTVLLVGYAVTSTPLYNPRYLSFGAPAVALLVAIGLSTLGSVSGHLTSVRLLAAALLVLLALPVYTSQRTLHAKRGADWKAVAAFVRERRGPDQAVYFAPRTPTTSNTIRSTSRTAAVLYPDAFEGVRDLTLVSTAAADGDLLGRSQPVASAVDRLDGMRTVFVVTRRDYPAEVFRADTSVLIAQGFGPGDSWTGPLNTVTSFTR